MGYFKSKMIDEMYIKSHFIGSQNDYDNYINDMEVEREHKRFSEAANRAKTRVRTRKIQSGTSTK